MLNSHDYHYQVNGEMALCEKPHCDFVCWTRKDIHVETIRRDDELLKQFHSRSPDHSIKAAQLPLPRGRRCSEASGSQ